MPELAEQFTSEEGTEVVEPIEMSMPEKKALALELVQGDGIAKDDFMEKLQLEKPSEFNMIAMILQAEGVLVVNDDGVIRGMSEEEFEKWKAAKGSTASAAKPDFKDLDLKQKRLVNAVTSKTKTHNKKMELYKKDPSDQLRLLEAQAATTGLQIANLKYDRWCAKACRDLGVESPSVLAEISSLDAYVIENNLTGE